MRFSLVDFDNLDVELSEMMLMTWRYLYDIFMADMLYHLKVCCP